MKFASGLRLGLAGILTAFFTGCATPKSPVYDLAESARIAIEEIEQARVSSHYEELAKKLEKYDILFFGETHPVGVSDSKIQPLGRLVPLLNALTDPRVVERPYRTIIVESLPVTYNFDGSRIVPVHEQEAISNGKFNAQSTPFLYDFTHSKKEFNFAGAKSFFGPVHGVESLEQIILNFAGTGVEIKGSLPDYRDVRETFERVSAEADAHHFNVEKARNELIGQLSCLVGKTTLSAVYSSMSDSLSLDLKPRIIIFGGKMHNDFGSPKAEKDLSYKFVSIREELSSFPYLRYGAVDIVNFATDGNSHPYDSLLQKGVSNLARKTTLPLLIYSKIPVFADYLLVFGEK